MQGITKGSKEKKKSSFISYRLEKGNKLIMDISKYSSMIYASLAVKAYINGIFAEQIIYGILTIVQLAILKVVLSQKQKLDSSDFQRKESIRDNTSIIDQGIDNLTASHVNILWIIIIQRALSVDFTSEYVSRFNDQRHIITDKEGNEAKSSINCDLKSIKTTTNHLDFMNDSPFINAEEEPKKGESQTQLNFDDLLLNNATESSVNKVNPCNLQHSQSVQQEPQKKRIIQEVGKYLQNKIQEKAVLPLMKAFTNFKKLEKKEKQIKLQDFFGITNSLCLILQIVYLRDSLMQSSHLIVYPLTLMMIEMIKFTVFTQKYQTCLSVLFNLCFYVHSESIINDLSLLIHISVCINLGFTRIQQMEQEEAETFENAHNLESNKNLIEQIFNTVPDGIGVTDFTGTSINNKIFAELMGDPSQPPQLLHNLKRFKRESTMNQEASCSLLEDLKMYQKILAQNRNSSLASESREYFTLQTLKQNQQNKIKSVARKYYMIFMSKIIYEGKICLLLTIRDITNQKVIQEKQVIDNMKNKIFKSFTHELMNPLNFLTFSFELITKHLSDIRTNPETFKKCKTVVATAESCTSVLRNIVLDFIDYSLLCTSNGGLVLKKQEFDLQKFITRIEKIMINQMKSKNVVFRISRGSDLPEKMYSDSGKLEQILLNLLLNAQKFTQKGWIKFKVLKINNNRKQSNFQSRQNSADINNSQDPDRPFDNFSIRFMVFDTGQGIEKERLSTLFNLFEQNENQLGKDSAQQRKSAGLGLTISQNLCHALGSKIKVKSTIREGSVFFFDLKYTTEAEAIKMSQGQKQQAQQQYGSIGGTSGYIQIGSLSFNRQDEENYEENEAVYLFKNQIGQFNTSFQLQMQQEEEEDQEEIYIRDNSVSRGILQLGNQSMVTIQEISETQSKYTNNFGAVSHSHTLNDQRSPQITTQKPIIRQLNDNMVRGSSYQNNNTEKIKQIIKKNRNLTHLNLNSLNLHDKFDINVKEEENDMIQIKVVSKKARDNDLALTVSDYERDVKTGVKQKAPVFFQKPLAYSEIAESVEESKTSKHVRLGEESQVLHKSKFKLKEEQFNSLIGSSRKSANEGTPKKDINTFRTMGTVDSMEEHISVDVIGDYSKLGKVTGPNDKKLIYKFQKQRLIQTQLISQFEPKLATPLKNPFNSYDFSEEEQKATHRSKSQIKFSSTMKKSTFQKKSNKLLLRLEQFNQTQHPSIQRRDSNAPSMHCSTGGLNTPRMSKIVKVKSTESNVKARTFSENEMIKQTFWNQETTEENKVQQKESEGTQTNFIRQLKTDNHNLKIPIMIDMMGEEDHEDQHQLQQLLSGTLHCKDSQHHLEYDQNMLQHLNSGTMSANAGQHTESLQPNLLDLKNFCCPEILVVDDIDYNRFALVSIISTLFDLECIEACNGQDCIDQVEEYEKKKCCDGLKLIIMDYEMPILNGLEAARILCQKMNSGELKKKIPIIALTAYNDEKDKCLSVGMKRFLTKPAKSEEIKDILFAIQSKSL